MLKRNNFMLALYSQVTRRHIVSDHEWLLHVDDIINTTIGMESGLDRVECHNRSVGTSATTWALIEWWR